MSGDELGLSEDMRFQRREWRVERIGWAVLALLLVAALLGFFASGPFSTSTAGEEGSTLWVAYDRFARRESQTTLVVHVAPPDNDRTEVRLAVGRDYLAQVQLLDIDPQPESVESRPDRFVYTFRVGGTGEPVLIVFDVQPNRGGTYSAVVGLEGGDRVRLSQFVYP